MGQSSVSRQLVALIKIIIGLTVSFLVCGSALAQHHIVACWRVHWKTA
jgi:hypothetical protein